MVILTFPYDVIFSDVENFEGGKLKYYCKNSKKYTSDTSHTNILSYLISSKMGLN